MGYELFPSDVAKALPPLYAQDELGDEAIAYVKFFTPDSNWSWFASEYDPKERMFFGLVIGMETELGYFSFDELQGARGPLGLPIERDVHWTPMTIGEIRAKHRPSRCA